MGGRYLIVSDLHLCDVEDHADGWKAYKSSRYVWDAAFAELLARVEARGEGPLTLVLNGDIIDFDLVSDVPESPAWPVRQTERLRGLDPSEPKSVWKLERVLSHHADFLRTLAGFVERGNDIVYVMGNHDREFHFPAVQRVLSDAIRAAGAADGRVLPESVVRFEPWFFHVEGEVYCEHGQQYDHYNSFRHLLEPTIPNLHGDRVIALPMGNLSNRYLLGRMGFFNPHASDFILNLYAYIVHWLKHYAFSRHRGIFLNWFFGSLAVIWKLLEIKAQLLREPSDDPALLAAHAAHSGLTVPQLESLAELQHRPITDRFFLVIREFWIDRVIIATLMTLGTIALAVTPIPLWTKLTVPLMGFPLVYAIYEWIVHGGTIFDVEHHMPAVARAIARKLGVRVVSFGHVHKPRLVAVDRGVLYADTGTWAPIMDRTRPDCLATGYRNYLSVDFSGGPDPIVDFGSWIPPGG